MACGLFQVGRVSMLVIPSNTDTCQAVRREFGFLVMLQQARDCRLQIHVESGSFGVADTHVESYVIDELYFNWIFEW